MVKKNNVLGREKGRKKEMSNNFRKRIFGGMSHLC